MHDNATICAKLEVMLQYYNELREVIKEINIDNYKENILIKRTIEREIQLIVESATNINNMILRRIKKGPANNSSIMVTFLASFYSFQFLSSHYISFIRGMTFFLMSYNMTLSLINNRENIQPCAMLNKMI